MLRQRGPTLSLAAARTAVEAMLSCLVSLGMPLAGALLGLAMDCWLTDLGMDPNEGGLGMPLLSPAILCTHEQQ